MLSVAGNRRLEQCRDLGLHAVRAVALAGQRQCGSRHAKRHLEGGTKEAIAPPSVTHLDHSLRMIASRDMAAEEGPTYKVVGCRFHQGRQGVASCCRTTPAAALTCEMGRKIAKLLFYTGSFAVAQGANMVQLRRPGPKGGSS